MSPQTLIEVLDRQVKERPTQLALSFELDDAQDLTWTYAELERRARGIAARIQAVTDPGQRVVLLFPPGLDYIAAFFGCLYAGVIGVPACYPKLNRPMPRLSGAVRDSQATLVLTNDWGLERFEQGSFPGDDLRALRWMSVEDLPPGMEDLWKPSVACGENLAFLQYTSGSTSDPKGVMVSHANLLHNLQVIERGFAHAVHGQGVFWLPAYHDMGLIGGILMPIYLGRPVSLMSPTAFLQRPLRWLQSIAQRRATISGAPNFAYDLCVEKATDGQIAELDLSHWELAFCGAEPVRRETLDRFADVFAPCGFRREAFYPCYGLAEATLMVSGGIGPSALKSLRLERAGLEKNRVVLADREQGACHIVTSGQTFDHQVVIADPDTLAASQPDQIGEIWIKSPSVARGYWNRAQETEQVFGARLNPSGEGPFLRTGDLGFVNDGQLYVTGRLKDLIIIRGRNFYPQDVEHTVESIQPASRRGSAAAFTVEVESEAHLVVVHEVERRHRRDLAEATISAIRAAIVREHEIQPHAVVLVKPLSLPKTSSGKIKRHACRGDFLRGRLQVVSQWTLQQENGVQRDAASCNAKARANDHRSNGAAPSNGKLVATKVERTAGEIRQWLVKQIAEHVGVDPQSIDPHAPLERCGLDSLGAVVLSGDLENWLGVRVQPTLVYDYPTIEAIAGRLASYGHPAAELVALATPAAAMSEPIAIVGMGCRFPGAADPDAFWKLLRDGVHGVSQVPADRWDIDELYDANPQAPGKMSTRWGGFLDSVDQFDPLFFGISPREASTMDPQQRLFLEVAWEAIEHAGLAPEKLSNTATGVFAGVCTHDYSQLFHRLGNLKQIDAYFGTGNAFSVTSGRLSHILGLQGPSLVVDTACSSSLVSVHLACQSLRTGECRAALAGGVTLMLSPTATINFSKAHMMAGDGRCKTFDAAADGYVRGEGCGIVVLKRLSDAQADGDRILAVIRGSAVNHDGHSNGLTAPNGLAQEAVIRQALSAAGVDPREVGYVEAHGTGTSLGDPIEVRAIGAAYGRGRTDADRLVIGSVKTNIGHLEAAAGIAGLIKTVLVLQHGEIPPHLHFQKINPYILLEEIPVRIPTERTPWPAGDQPRIAGVSAYAFSGTNAHVVLEEVPARAPALQPRERPLHLMTLSAKSDVALRSLAARYQAHLQSHSDQSLADAAFSANTGRAHHPFRLAVTGQNSAELAERLAAFAAGEQPVGAATGQVDGARRPKIVFLFTGQGSQYVGMGRELYETQPTFRSTMDRCAAGLEPYLDQPLLSVLYGADGASLLDETAYTQPALFALEYSLAQLWKSWGVEPAAVAGHSVGEYVAACVAGVFSLEDGLKLIARRAKLMQQLPAGGQMAAVFAALPVVEQAVAPHQADVAVATINGPENVVISGAGEAVQQVLAKLAAAGILSQPLAVSHAFHSPLMTPMLDEFERAACEVEFHAPRIPIVSNATGRFVEGDELSQPVYWRRHVRDAVRFFDSIAALHEEGFNAFVEIGPGSTLLGLSQKCVGRDAGLWLPSLRRNASDWKPLLESLASLYASGAKIGWAGFDGDYARRGVAMPTYPFQRERYWMNFSGEPERPASASAATGRIQSAQASPHPLLGARLRSPLKDQLFEAELSTSALPYLDDHQIYRTVVLPATAYLEMALSAAHEALAGASSGIVSLEQVRLKRPLLLSHDAAQSVQVVLSPEKGQTSFQITSLSEVTDEGDHWLLHARGRVRLSERSSPTTTASLEQLAARCPEQLPVGLYYQRLEMQGLHYGPAFQPLRQVKRGDGEALGLLRLDESLDAENYQIHPALLDGCFQLMGAALPSGDLGAGVFVPVGLEKFRLERPAGSALWCHVQLRQEPTGRAVPGMIKGDLTLLTESGELLGEVAGLWLARATPEQLIGKSQPRIEDWLYEVAWQPQDLVDSRPAKVETVGPWLVLIDQGGVGAALADQLELRGDTTIRVRPGNAFAWEGPGRCVVDPLERQDFERLLSESSTVAPFGFKGLIHLWSFDGGSKSALAVEEAVARGCGSLLHLIQATAARGSSLGKPRLWIGTRGAQAIGEHAVSASQSALWGLGRVAALEHPELRPTLVDLDPQAPHDGLLESLLEELHLDDSQNQLAYRDGQRYAARLVRSVHGAPAESPAGPVRLEILRRGMLDNLALQSVSRRQPTADEVEIEVRATGLNFRDVLNALGLYPGDPGPLGGECAGRVARVGANVQHLAVGDEVLGIASGSFSTYVTTPAAVVVRKPAEMTFEQAATTPIAFLTAHYGLNHLAKMEAGDRLLLHAASGGVGLAAIQLAHRAGVEVLGTAGNPQKRQFLHSLGVNHVMNSRSVEFADQVPQLTGGAGVDVVLNSFAGEFIPKSLSVLRTGGTFLEIGKAEIWDGARVEEVKPGVAYHAIALDQMVLDNPQFVGQMLEELMALFAAGELQPLPHKVFALPKAVDAFRFMAQAKHIGKIVVSAAPADAARHERTSGGGRAAPSRGWRQLRTDGAYLITGGLGALGLHVARSFAMHGAGRLVLTSRRSPQGAALRAIEELRQAGVTVDVVAADVGKREDAVRLLAEIGDLASLRGVIHAAGVLDDGVLAKQSWERFQTVLSPKVSGAWNLHELTQQSPLDFFVMFSSVASILGSPGQGNYAAANAFMDGLARHRRAAGLPAISVNWGPWADGGMAAAAEGRGGRQLNSGGLEPIPAAQGVELLNMLLDDAPAEVVAMNVNWREWCQSHPKLSKMPLLATMTEQFQSQRPASKHREKILAAPAGDRQQAVQEYLRQQVARIMQIPADKLDVLLPLSALGLDSLMAVEMKNLVEVDLDVAVPAAMLLEGPSVAQLSAELLSQLVAGDDAPATKPAAAVETNGHAPAETNGDAAAARPERWLANYRPQPAPTLRLFCFHYLGGGASAFRDWQDELPPQIEVCPVQLPGRENRRGDVPIDRMADLVTALVENLSPYCDRPLAIYGHSMGTIVGFEFARRLQAERGISPTHFFAGGYYAPEMRSRFQTKRHWEEDEIISKAATLLEAPEEILANKEFMRALAPTIKADLSLLGEYQYAPGSILDCPLTAFGGVDDHEVTEADVAVWRNYSSGRFDLQMAPGGHLFLLDHRRWLVQRILRQLQRYLSSEILLTPPSLVQTQVPV